MQAGKGALRQWHVALGRKPAEGEREHVDQQKRDHEHRRGKAEHRERHHDAIGQTAGTHRSQRAERQRDRDRQHDRHQRQHRCRFQSLADQAADRDIGKHRASEIAAQQLACPCKQLIDQRVD